MRPIDADMLSPDRDYYDNSPYSGYDAVSCSQIDDAPTIKAILIPEGATNGDMIKAMFPNCKITLDNEGLIGVRPIGENWIIWFTQSWWNAPYKGVQNDKD